MGIQTTSSGSGSGSGAGNKLRTPKKFSAVSNCTTQCNEDVFISDYCNVFTQAFNGILSSKYTSYGAMYYADNSCTTASHTVVAGTCGSAAEQETCRDGTTTASAIYNQEIQTTSSGSGSGSGSGSCAEMKAAYKDSSCCYQTNNTAFTNHSQCVTYKSTYKSQDCCRRRRARRGEF